MFCRHEYGWPRRVAGVDIQTCTRCGEKKASSVQFSSLPVETLESLISTMEHWSKKPIAQWTEQQRAAWRLHHFGSVPAKEARVNQ